MNRKVHASGCSRLRLILIALARHWGKGGSSLHGATKMSHFLGKTLSVKLTDEDIAYLEEPYMYLHVLG